MVYENWRSLPFAFSHFLDVESLCSSTDIVLRSYGGLQVTFCPKMQNYFCMTSSRRNKSWNLCIVFEVYGIVSYRMINTTAKLRIIYLDGKRANLRRLILGATCKLPWQFAQSSGRGKKRSGAQATGGTDL